MSDPRGFLKFRRMTPERRSVQERIRDFREFYRPMHELQLSNQGARCMDCGVPFCQGGSSYAPGGAIGCPVQNLIPDFNDLVHRARWKEALKALHSTNNFPEFTGKLCPAPCESACVLGLNSDPVAIRTIESAIIDRGFHEGWVQPVAAAEKTGRRVAIVGSGPAGLAAAQQLARAGHKVTVFEKADRAGGLLRYGIPDFKMEKWVLDRRLEQLAAEGVEFRCGVAVGSDFPVKELLARYDAVGLALGAEKPRDLEVPGRELGGIHFAMDYLIQQNRVDAGLPLSGPTISAHGKKVVILGGGDTGSDCLGTAHRQGCASVAQFEVLPKPPEERASSTPWPLWPLQLRSSHAHEEGGDRRWSITTTGFRGRGGRVVALMTSAGEIECDLVLLAMGFTGPVRAPLIDALRLRADARGCISADPWGMSNRPGVFAAGDVRRGASLIVWAIAEGRRMAEGIDRWLRSGHSLLEDGS